jgi:16S rRNA processing protein RimM
MNPDPRRLNSGGQDDLVKIGEVIKPHGIKGEVKVFSYSGRPENFKNYNTIVLQQISESGTQIYRIVKSRAQGKVAILELDGVASRDAAEALQGSTVWLKKGDFQKLSPDEYYWYQLENLQVITESGRELGKVSGLFSTPAHDIMIVTGKGREYMVPVKAGIIVDIDELGGKIIISPPAGLLDINK